MDEDFVDGSIPPPWMTGGGLDVLVQNGVLGVVLIQADFVVHGWAHTPFIDLSDRTITIEVGAPPVPSGNGQLLLKLSTFTEEYSLLVEAGSLAARSGASDGTFVQHASTAYSQNGTRFLQLSHVGDTMRYAYSGDGRTFTTLYEHTMDPTSDMTAAEIAILGGTWQYENEVGFVGIDWISVCP